MQIVGYSGTPLIKKLGIKSSMKILLFHVPENYMLLLDKDISNQYAAAKETPDLIHLFVTT